MHTTIVDYGMGNLQSVRNALAALGFASEVLADPKQLKTADRIILPGVGSFRAAMENIRNLGWQDALNEAVIGRKRPFLGICLGLQLLADTGAEHGPSPGLGWIPGAVEQLESDEDARLPHIGWNTVRFSPGSMLYRNLGESADFYFVNSYALVPLSESVISGKATHKSPFVASIERENIVAVQFHPEKSQQSGLAVLKNFYLI